MLSIPQSISPTITLTHTGALSSSWVGPTKKIALYMHLEDTHDLGFPGETIAWIIHLQ